MKFETKFNKDDKAWYMKKNIPVQVVISSIEISYVNLNIYIKYNAKNIKDSVSWLDHTNIFEHQLFKTKLDLLKSVFGDIKVCNGKGCSAINGYEHSDECSEEHEEQYHGISKGRG